MTDEAELVVGVGAVGAVVQAVTDPTVMSGSCYLLLHDMMSTPFGEIPRQALRLGGPLAGHDAKPKCDEHALSLESLFVILELVVVVHVRAGAGSRQGNFGSPQRPIL